MTYKIVPELNGGLDGTNTSPYAKGYKIVTWGLKDWCKHLNRKHPDCKFAPTRGQDGLWYIGELIQEAK